MKARITLALILGLSTNIWAKDAPEVLSQENYGMTNEGTSIRLTFEKGKEHHNHPLFAIWLTDENGKYIQTLYVSESIAHATFRRADINTGRWLEGQIQRPATVPYWAHQRGVLNEYGTYMPTIRERFLDAYSGATPQKSFVLNVKTEKPLKGRYRVMFEVNQSWDWNEYWYNDKFPDDKEYKTSSQPAIVYSAEIDSDVTNTYIELKPIGHSHYSGANGSLTTDLSTITTALKIAKKITVTVL